MRKDHTSWLIHFVRDRDPEQDFPAEDEDTELFLAGGEMEVDAGAFQVLSTILRLGGLCPGYSFRGGKTTLYGGRPVLCATEMPIYSFAKYAQQRNNTARVSPYGIAFLKSEFYAAGGRPAIYGLSTERVSYQENSTWSRIIDPDILPISEQYRLVSFSLDPTKLIDWTHEREWRWVPTDKERHMIAMKNGYDIFDLVPGLPLLGGVENDGYFSKIGIIVWTAEEAAEIQSELTGYYFAKGNNYGTPFSRSLLERSFLVILDDLVEAVETRSESDMETIEGISASSLLKPLVLCENTEVHNAEILAAVSAAKEAGRVAAEDYIRRHPEDHGSCGFGNVTTYKVTHPIVQQMLKMDVASGPFDGKAILFIRGGWEVRQSIDYNEHIARAMCAKLNETLGDLFHWEGCLD